MGHFSKKAFNYFAVNFLARLTSPLKGSKKVRSLKTIRLTYALGPRRYQTPSFPPLANLQTSDHVCSVHLTSGNGHCAFWWLNPVVFLVCKPCRGQRCLSSLPNTSLKPGWLDHPDGVVLFLFLSFVQRHPSLALGYWNWLRDADST